MGDNETLDLAGRRLREERERCGLSLEQAAGELRLHRSHLWRIERGERGLDSIVLRGAAALYGVAMDAFFAEAVDRGVVVKARMGDGDDDAAAEMAAWTRRKLEEWRFVTGEISARRD